MITTSQRVHGCLVGGAVGDALGAPIEFHDISTIHRLYGKRGLRHYVEAYGRIGAITDDTQLTLFTAEGLLEAGRGHGLEWFDKIDKKVHAAYLRWLRTQNSQLFTVKRPKGLAAIPALNSQRAPGGTCLSSLRDARTARVVGECPPDQNDSKGTGGVMRIAPVGLLGPVIGSDADVFLVGARLAWLTHQHRSGYLAAGFMAVMIASLMRGEGRLDAINLAEACLLAYDGGDEVRKAVDQAVNLSKKKGVAWLGRGWVAEEALAIAIFCLLRTDNFMDGVAMAVNHSGDSDTTGAMAGNLLGAFYGRDAIPSHLTEELELKNVIEEMADALVKRRAK